MDSTEVSSTAVSGLLGQRWSEQMLSGELSKREQVDQLAGQFEGVLLRQFLDLALKPMDPESGYFGSKTSPMHEHIIKDTLVSSITKGGSLGFSSVLQSQLFPDGVSPVDSEGGSHE